MRIQEGAAANQEVANKLRGIFAALSGRAFWCHESLGWAHGEKGYPPGAVSDLGPSRRSKTRKAIIECGVNPAAMDENIARLLESLHICGGWRAAVGRLKSLGWFANRDVNLVRREFAKSALRDLSDMASTPKELRKAQMKSLKQVVEWFMNEARESGVKIGWLLK